MARYSEVATSDEAVLIETDDFALVYDRRNRAFHKKLWNSSTKSWTTKVAPYSALVAKDGSTVWAEDASGKTIASGEAGVDDASVIQGAVNALESGGKIFIKGGTYHISSTIYINHGIMLVGERGSTILKAENDFSNIGMLRLGETWQYKIGLASFQEIVFDGNNVGNDCVRFQAQDLDLHVEGCEFRNWADSGIKLLPSSASTYQRIFVSDCLFKNNKVGLNIGSPDTVDTPISVLASNLRFINSAKEEKGAFELRGVKDCEINNIIIDNQGEGHYGFAILDDADGVSVSNMVIRGATCNGFLIDDQNSPVNIKNIVVNNVHVYDCTGSADGFDIETCDKIILSNCVSVNNGGDGFEIGCESDYQMSDVLMINCKAYGNGEYGVRVAYVTNIQILNSDLEGNDLGALAIGDNVINGKFRDIHGYMNENSGTATFSGDGTTTQFSIAHGLVSTPTKVLVTPMTADAASDFYVTADDTNIYINYLTAPASGTDNLKFSWFAEV